MLSVPKRCLVALVVLSSCSAAISAQDALLRRAYPVAAPGGSLGGVVARVLQGPSAAQRRAGLTTAVPRGTVLLSLDREGPAVTLTLSHQFATILDRGAVLEDAVSQIVKTVVISIRRSKPMSEKPNSLVIMTDPQKGTPTINKGVTDEPIPCRNYWSRASCRST